MIVSEIFSCFKIYFNIFIFGHSIVKKKMYIIYNLPE
jgi:hypothetical protein